MSDAARQILVLTKSDDEPTSFTSVRTEADRIQRREHLTVQTAS